MSTLDAAVEAQIEAACPSLTAARAFELADAIECEIEPGESWVPSRLARKIGCRTHEAGQVLDWMVSQHYLRCDDRGAWTHYFR